MIASQASKIRDTLMAQLPSVGEEVTLTFKNKSPTLSGPLGHITPKTVDVKGKVAVKPRWDTDPDNFALVVPNTPVVVRIINIHDVEAINGKPLFKRGKRATREPKIFKIKGSRGDQVYTVTFDGVFWNCDCPGFHFRKNCRHVREAREKHEGTK